MAPKKSAQPKKAAPTKNAATITPISTAPPQNNVAASPNDPSEFTDVVETVQDRLRNELDQQKKTLAIKQEELIQLKEELTANLTDPSTKRKAIETKMATTQGDLTLRIESMQALEQSIEIMTKDIELIKIKKQEAEDRLSEKRGILNIELKIFIELEMLIIEIDGEIQQIYDNYQNLIAQKEQDRLNILNDPNLSPAEKEQLINKLDDELKGLREECADVMSDLAIKQDEWAKNSKAYAEQLQKSLDDAKEKYNDEVEGLERMKIGATPSEIIKIDAKIAALKEAYESNIKLIQNALARKEYFYDQFGRYFINEDGIKVYQRYSNASQYIMDADGNLVKIADAVPEEVPPVVPKTPSQVSITTMELKQKEDQEYIKRELGTPLRLALAKITMLQPSDPINYLANYLLEYRYNEVMNIKKEGELEALLTERANLKEEIRKHKIKKQQQEMDPKKKERQVWPHCTTCDQILPKDDLNL